MHEEEAYLLELATLATVNDSITLAFVVSILLGIYFYGTKDD